MAPRRSILSLLSAFACGLLIKHGFLFAHRAATTLHRLPVIPPIVRAAQPPDKGKVQSDTIEVIEPAVVSDPVVPEEVPKIQRARGEEAPKKQQARAGWQWSPRAEHVDVFEGSDSEEAPAPQARSTALEAVPNPEATRKLTTQERRALRLPFLDERKLALEEEMLAGEQEDRTMREILGPFGGWVYDKCQPRKWGPYGVLQFKLLFLVIMFVFMMKTVPVLVDILTIMTR